MLYVYIFEKASSFGNILNLTILDIIEILMIWFSPWLSTDDFWEFTVSVKQSCKIYFINQKHILAHLNNNKIKYVLGKMHDLKNYIVSFCFNDILVVFDCFISIIYQKKGLLQRDSCRL